jgi:hypothetical protein
VLQHTYVSTANPISGIATLTTLKAKFILPRSVTVQWTEAPGSILPLFMEAQILQDCVCGTHFLDSQATIEAIAKQPSCLADFDVNKCSAGPYDMEVDLWTAIQAGSCTCVNYTTDVRTLQLYWNDHPLAATYTMPNNALVHSSLLLSAASMTSVAMAAFIFAFLWWRNRATPRRQRNDVMELYMGDRRRSAARIDGTASAVRTVSDFDAPSEVVPQFDYEQHEHDDDGQHPRDDGQL